MALTAAEIEQVLEEIAPVVRGGWFQKIYQPSDRTLVFDIRVPGKTFRLLVSCEAGRSRLHFIHKSPTNPPTPPSFCQFLRAHFQGARIDDVRQIPNDRIVEFQLTTKDGLRTLVCELTGKKATVKVLDAEGRVLRELLGRQDPHPVRSQLPSVEKPRSLLHGAARFIKAHDGEFPLSAAIEAYYHETEITATADRVQATRQQALKKALKKIQRRIHAWREDLVQAGKYRDYARYGELLKTNIRSVKKGMRHITLIDYFDEAMPEITIPLDVTKSAQSNMDDYFKKHRKCLTAERELAPRLEQAARELSAIQNELTDIDQGRWAFPEPTAGQTIPQAVKQKDKGLRNRPFRRFCSADGLPIFVGRNARENDDLTFGLAKSEDLWLHARGTPGSHVIVRLEKGQEAPLESLRDAATLALLYSDLKKSGKGEVIYTKRKWVKKAKNQAPGAVMVTQEQSLYVHLDRIRLQALKQRATGD